MEYRASDVFTPEQRALLPKDHEDRMEARREKLLRYLQETPEALQTRAARGMVAMAAAGKTKVVPWHQSNTPDGPVLAPNLRSDSRDVHATWDGVPVLRQRTLEERMQSMATRIAAAPEPLRERLIKDAVGEYWKEGMPVTAEALRAVAAKYLNRSAGPIRVTRP